jgi:hypothetical protein
MMALAAAVAWFTLRGVAPHAATKATVEVGRTLATIDHGVGSLAAPAAHHRAVDDRDPSLPEPTAHPGIAVLGQEPG